VNQFDALLALDADIHAALLNAGLADRGHYHSTSSAPGTACDVYLDRDVQVLGQFGEVMARRDEMGIRLAGVQPARNGRVVLQLEGGAETWVLVDPVGDDGAISRWAVRRG